MPGNLYSLIVLLVTNNFDFYSIKIRLQMAELSGNTKLQMKVTMCECPYRCQGVQ